MNDYFDSIFHGLYKVYVHVPIVSHFTSRLKRMHAMIMPSSERRCRILCSRDMTLIAALWVGMIAAYSMIGRNTLYKYLILIVVLYAVTLGVVQRAYENGQLRLLIKFDDYLAEVRHYFHMNAAIEDAVYESMENADKLMVLHINEMYSLLISRKENMIEKYKDMAPNKYFLTFMGLLNIVMTYGDTENVFLDNLGSLRDEVRCRILKINKIRHTFSGLSIMCILPVLSLKLIEKWGISNLPELESYYDGVYGLVVSIAIVILSMTAYGTVLFLKGDNDLRPEEHGILRKLENVSFIKRAADRYLFAHADYEHKLKNSIRKAASSVTVRQFVIKRALMFNAVSLLTFIGIMYGLNLNGVSMPDRRLVIFMMISCLTGYLAGLIPGLFLTVKRLLMSMDMEDEVMQFHSIILMLMYVGRMSSEVILEWMEDFAFIFKNSIMRCNMIYSMDAENALERLKEDEPFIPFLRIVENLEACDRVGCVKAFEEISMQKQYFIEKRKQDNEISISNKGTIGKVAAYVPLFATVFMYLIVPFVAESLNQLTGYTDIMKTL